MNETEYFYLKQQIRALLDIDIDAYKGAQMRRRLETFVARRTSTTALQVCKSLKHDPETLKALKDTITINVTEFFRDVEQFRHLEKVVLPELLRQRSHLNIWAAGCSTGAEPYSLALILNELSSARDHRILATDIDADVLTQAKAGGPYPPNEVQNVPKGLLQKYFTAEKRGYMIAEEVRREVLFRKHNLLSDGFQIGFDVILCRNVIIYFSDEAKATLFSRFRTALKPKGVLFIGGTEALLPANSQGFEQIATNFYRKSVLPAVDAKREKAA